MSQAAKEVPHKMRIIISFAKEASILILKWDCDNENAMNTTETRKLYIVSSNLCRRIRIRTKVMIAWLNKKIDSDSEEELYTIQK